MFPRSISARSGNNAARGAALSCGLFAAFVLAGCAVQMKRGRDDATARLTEVASAPLVDLNLIRTKIPEALNVARENPYLAPPDHSCAALAEEITRLDEALGPDLDVAKPDPQQDFLDRGTTEAKSWAWDALKGTAEGLLPYRGWLRRLTGAERHSKEVSAAIAAGIVRRAYLKGIGQAVGCGPLAAPRQAD